MKIASEVIEKLRKILILANNRAAYKGEVEAAMAKAREIAIAHNIELSSIDLDSEEQVKGSITIEKDETLRIRSKFKQPYHNWVFFVLREVFHVHVIERSHSLWGGKVVSAIILVGEAGDVAIAKAVFPFLEKVFPAILSRFVSEGTLTYCAADTNGCYRGIFAGIVETNRREEAKIAPVQTNRYALVVRRKGELVQAAVEKHFPYLERRKGRRV